MVLAALVMGLPTLRGGFVGGDDRQLVLNHVLVNHPSFSHAVQLFTIVHRDLYQPIPLLTFSGEFAIANAFGLFDSGVSGGAWLFHLTNVLLHAINAALVWAVIVTWRARPGETQLAPTWIRDSHAGAYAIATMAALLFAVHPLQVEVVAWVNGRMMLLSTLFALLSVASLGRWLRGGRLWWAVLVVLCVAMCGLSKVRVGLPLALVMLPLARGHRISARLVWLWIVSTVVMGVLVVINIQATAQAGMFEGAATTLQGPRLARVAMALAWYFQHYLWPTGLAAWYPTPGTVGWTDAFVLRAALVVVPVMAVLAWMAWRSRVALVGIGWFFLTIASTLPFIPTRKLLAADRYMYLPVVGLVWLTGLGLWKLIQVVHARRPGVAGPAAVSIGLAIAAALTASSWHVAGFYDTYLTKTMRIATLFPETPHIWERVAWSYFKEERYDEAIETAKREFAHDDKALWAEALAVIGKSQLRLGFHDEAIQSLREAVQLSPKTGLPKYRLAYALDELGLVDQAIPYYEESLESLLAFNPGLVKLAAAYRQVGRPELAAERYEQALAVNPYEVPALLGLAELDIELGTKEALASAEDRLVRLLDWMPENAAAWTDLGVVQFALGRRDKAVEAYDRALANDPYNATAALNLAQLSLQDGRAERARELFDRAASSVESTEQAVAIHDFYVSQRQPQRAAAMWAGFVESHPLDARAQVFLTWSRVLSGDLGAAKSVKPPDGDTAAMAPLHLAAQAFVALVEERYADANALAVQLSESSSACVDARARLLGALQGLSEHRPNSPWTFCMAARLLAADGNTEPARMSVDLCEERCGDQACRNEVAALRGSLVTD